MQAKLDYMESILAGVKINAGPGMDMMVQRISRSRNPKVREKMPALKAVAEQVQEEVAAAGPCVVLKDLGDWDPDGGTYSKEIQDRQAELAAKVAEWSRSNESGLEGDGGPDPLMPIIFSMVLFFSPAALELQQPTVVGRIQRKYLSLLHKYLRTKHDAREARTRLMEVQKVVATCKEIGRLKGKHAAVV